MDFSWARIQESVKIFWNKLSRPQKIITIVAPLLVAVALFSLIAWAGTPQYVAIFTKLSDTDAAAIMTKLKDLKADYKLADNGSTIMVPQQSSADIRLQLASAGLPQESKFSFDSLNTMHLGETDADRKLRYVLGLQNELESTLKALNGVQDAHVNIVMPDPSLFVDSQKPATAAVTLKLVPGTKLGDDQVRAIANLMAGSVEGLQMENVTIVDTSGNVLSDSLSKSGESQHMSGTQFQLQQTVEEDTRKSVQSMLDRVLGSGKTIVRINAVLNFDQIKRTIQTNGPGAVVSEQSSTENTSNATAAGGTPGVASNAAPTYPTGTSGVNTTSTKANATKNYQVDTKQEEQVVSPGAVKRLSVSVMADSDIITPTQLDQIKTIVASAAGVDQTRGDQIQVAAIPFNKTELQQEKAAMDNAQKRQQLVSYIEMGLAAMVGLVFLLMQLRKRSKKASTEKMLGLNVNGSEPVTLANAELLMAEQLAEKEAELKLERKSTKSVEELEKQKTKEAVELYARNNPDEVARLMKTWLSEDS